ncbi:MAG: hypothetical protein ACNYPD_00825 [Candidatus Halichondribacter symbioticus]
MDNKIQYHEVKNFLLQSGRTVKVARLGYCVFGDINKPIIVLHTAVSGNPRAYSETKKGYGDGWWNRHFGENKMLDTNKFCIICISHFGGNGPSSTADELNIYRPYLTILDTCHLAAIALKDMGHVRIHAAIGVSMGAPIAREWLFQDHLEVSRIIEIFGNFGNNHVGSIAKKYVHIQIDLLHSDGSNLKKIEKRISTNCEAMCNESRAYSLAYNHIMNEYQTLYKNFSDENVLRITRMIGFFRFVTPQYFQQKWDAFFCANQDKQFADSKLTEFCNHLGDTFIKNFKRSSLASLRYMDAQPQPALAEKIAKNILKKDTRVLGLIVRGDRLYESDLQFDYYCSVQEKLPKLEKNRLKIHLCSNFLRGHDHFLSEEFLLEGSVIHKFLIKA